MGNYLDIMHHNICTCVHVPFDILDYIFDNDINFSLSVFEHLAIGTLFHICFVHFTISFDLWTTFFVCELAVASYHMLKFNVSSWQCTQGCWIVLVDANEFISKLEWRKIRKKKQQQQQQKRKGKKSIPLRTYCETRRVRLHAAINCTLVTNHKRVELLMQFYF